MRPLQSLLPSADSAADPLAGLRGYHLPDPVAWWPPATGWWLLLAMVLILSAAIWWWRRRLRRRAWHKAALAELGRLEVRLDSDAGDAEIIPGVSRLLRRYALVVFPGEKIAALTGEAWLSFLDSHGGDGAFKRGHGRCLAEAPYSGVSQTEVRRLLALARRWIERNPEVRR